MRLMRILIVLILCIKSLYRALPVQSKALENTDDQLFWQAAWFSEDSKPASPFTSDSKKITAKSIFITPNFVNQPAQYCPDGYRIDNGKCIKIFSFHQTSEEMLATRLSSLITTDDTTNFDYDYDSFEDEQNNDNNEQNGVKNQEELKLPLVPILHESNEDETDSYNSNINAKNITVKEYETEVTTDNPFMSSTNTFHDFHTENKTDSVEIIITTLSSDDDENNSNRNDTTYEHDIATIKPSVDEFHENLNDDDVNENFSLTFSNTTTSPEQIDLTTTTTTIAVTTAALEYENITEKISSNKNETSVMQDRNNDDNQNVEPSFLLLPLAETLVRENSTKNNNNFTIIDSISNSNSTININNSSSDDEILSNSTVLDFNENLQTEESIIESSDTINFDDSSFLVNDSLIMIDNTSSILNSSINADYDDITTIDPFMNRNDEDQTTLQTQTSADDVNSDNVSIKTDTTDENTSITDEDKTSAFKYETTSYYSLDDRQNSKGDDETNKFVYHHQAPTTEATTTTTIETSTQSVKGNKLKFPDEEINNRVRFPDDYNNNNDEIVTTSSRIQSRLIPSSSTSATSRFSWPRENNHRLTTNIFQFWNQQPLLEDFQRARENSKSFRADDFFPYTRKVQIVTPQRYNY
ncbi:probable serine/threonine-protein kinase DDB_G0282963 [Chironomus tepperi]|uniref:probable serine/threonine-protein kinase DDB_G0282963 n=1 Tax=Chironomus tepperi TaxID=113505 RepID=UPI00391EEAC0